MPDIIYRYRDNRTGRYVYINEDQLGRYPDAIVYMSTGDGGKQDLGTVRSLGMAYGDYEPDLTTEQRFNRLGIFFNEDTRTWQNGDGRIRISAPRTTTQRVSTSSEPTYEQRLIAIGYGLNPQTGRLEAPRLTNVAKRRVITDANNPVNTSAAREIIDSELNGVGPYGGRITEEESVQTLMPNTSTAVQAALDTVNSIPRSYTSESPEARIVEPATGVNPLDMPDISAAVQAAQEGWSPQRFTDVGKWTPSVDQVEEAIGENPLQMPDYSDAYQASEENLNAMRRETSLPEGRVEDVITGSVREYDPAFDLPLGTVMRPNPHPSEPIVDDSTQTALDVARDFAAMAPQGTVVVQEQPSQRAIGSSGKSVGQEIAEEIRQAYMLPSQRTMASTTEERATQNAWRKRAETEAALKEMSEIWKENPNLSEGEVRAIYIQRSMERSQQQQNKPTSQNIIQRVGESIASAISPASANATALVDNRGNVVNITTPALKQPVGTAQSEYSADQQKMISDIRNVAQKYGVDENLLLNIAWNESRFNPNAKSSKSSAKGLFQITNPTWRDLVKNYGSTHGITSSGVYDPVQNATGSALLLQGHQKAYEKAGIPVNNSTLYMGNFLGRTGAINFLNEYYNGDPNKIAATSMAKAAEANPSLFYKDYDKYGTKYPRTYAELFDLMGGKLTRTF